MIRWSETTTHNLEHTFDQTLGLMSSLIHVFFFFPIFSYQAINTFEHMDQILLLKMQLDFCDKWKTRKNALENKWNTAKYIYITVSSFGTFYLTFFSSPHTYFWCFSCVKSKFAEKKKISRNKAHKSVVEHPARSMGRMVTTWYVEQWKKNHLKNTKQ